MEGLRRLGALDVERENLSVGVLRVREDNRDYGDCLVEVRLDGEDGVNALLVLVVLALVHQTDLLQLRVQLGVTQIGTIMYRGKGVVQLRVRHVHAVHERKHEPLALVDHSRRMTTEIDGLVRRHGQNHLPSEGG